MELNKENLMSGLFSNTPSTINQDEVVKINLKDIRDCSFHTFKLRKEPQEQWNSFVESVRRFGVKQPILVRKHPFEENKYECIAGHQRRAAAAEVALENIPAIVLNLDDDEAKLLMVVTNKQRESWLPSEKARGWKIEYETLKNQGARNDIETSRQNVEKLSAEEQMEMISGQDIRTVQRFIKLNDLNENLLDMVDNKKLAANVAYNISFLSAENQEVVEDLISVFKKIPNEAATYFRKMQDDSIFNIKTASDYLTTLVNKEKPFKLTEKEVQDCFPCDYIGSPEDKVSLIKNLIKEHFKKEEKNE